METSSEIPTVFIIEGQELLCFYVHHTKCGKGRSMNVYKELTIRNILNMYDNVPMNSQFQKHPRSCSCLRGTYYHVHAAHFTGQCARILNHLDQSF